MVRVTLRSRDGSRGRGGVLNSRPPLWKFDNKCCVSVHASSNTSDERIMQLTYFSLQFILLDRVDSESSKERGAET